MSDMLNYMIWYHRVLGSSKKGQKALEYYGDYKSLYDAVFEDRDTSGLTESATLGKYTSFSAIDAEKVRAVCEKNGWEIIPCTSEYYPKALLEISNYPHILFSHGKKEILKRSVAYAIVGSREAAPQAESIAYNCAYNLAKTGAVIVSGAALGIDSASHLGAVDAGGETVGILGCGLGSTYMDRIGDFYGKVLSQGVYITEMFPYENPQRFSFPERNRLISGMSRAVLVACAAKKSGSLVTAEHARKQKRRVYALAPEICYSEGCENLLKNGAYYFYHAGDIAYSCKEFYEEGTFNEAYCNRPVSINEGNTPRESMALPKKKGDVKEKTKEKPETGKKAVEEKAPAEKKEAAPKELPSYLSDNARLIYELIGDNTVIIDELVDISELRIPHVLIAISELETERLIKTVPGGRVEKIK